MQQGGTEGADNIRKMVRLMALEGSDAFLNLKSVPSSSSSSSLLAIHKQQDKIRRMTITQMRDERCETKTAEEDDDDDEEEENSTNKNIFENKERNITGSVKCDLNVESKPFQRPSSHASQPLPYTPLLQPHQEESPERTFSFPVSLHIPIIKTDSNDNATLQNSNVDNKSSTPCLNSVAPYFSSDGPPYSTTLATLKPYASDSQRGTLEPFSSGLKKPPIHPSSFQSSTEAGVGEKTRRKEEDDDHDDDDEENDDDGEDNEPGSSGAALQVSRQRPQQHQKQREEKLTKEQTKQKEEKKKKKEIDLEVEPGEQKKSQTSKESKLFQKETLPPKTDKQTPSLTYQKRTRHKPHKKHIKKFLKSRIVKTPSFSSSDLAPYSEPLLDEDYLGKQHQSGSSLFKKNDTGLQKEKLETSSAQSQNEAEQTSYQPLPHPPLPYQPPLQQLSSQQTFSQQTSSQQTFFQQTPSQKLTEQPPLQQPTEQLPLQQPTEQSSSQQTEQPFYNAPLANMKDEESI